MKDDNDQLEVPSTFVVNNSYARRPSPWTPSGVCSLLFFATALWFLVTADLANESLVPPLALVILTGFVTLVLDYSWRNDRTKGD